MKQTERTLLEQMKITDFEIAKRKDYFGFTQDDVMSLRSIKPIIDNHIDALVDRFYELQTEVPDIALLIGDADTLHRLHTAQHRYVNDLFSGVYDMEYVNNRLRIGMVHKRIGVAPHLYLSAVYVLKSLLNDLMRREIKDDERCANVIAAMEKLFLFDVTLVVDTYIRSLLSEIETAKQKSDLYAQQLEDKVRERTEQLEELSRTDALTGLLNVRYFLEDLTGALRTAQRRNEPLTLVYIDINDFKEVNDTQGHQLGDDLLRKIGESIKSVSRINESCYRYGGDEFCIILPNCDERTARDNYKQRLLADINSRIGDVTISVGIFQTGPNDYLDADALIKSADKMMYVDKKKSKALRDVNDNEGPPH